MSCKALVVLVLLTPSCRIMAESVADSLGSHWGTEASAMPGTVIVMDHYQRQWQKGKGNFAADLRLTRSALPQDSDAFASDYNYPLLAVGLMYSFNHGVTMRRTGVWGKARMVDYDSRLGNVISLYGSFERFLVRTRKWSTSYELDFGLAYSHKKYNPQNNIDDELIGSNVNIHFGAGLFAGYRVARDWGLKAGIRYYHYSNGALSRPNKGVNVIGPVIGVVYEPYYEDVLDGRKDYKPASFNKYWYLNFTGGFGGKTLDEDWQKTQFNTDEGEPRYRTSRFHLYAACSFRADIMYRYSRRWASGIGADVFYGSYASHIKEMDEDAGRRLKHSPVSFGLSACHEVFYHNFSLAVSFGWYLYRHMGASAKELETPYYEHIGLRYAFPVLKGLQVGIDVKAHKTKADLTEIVLALPVRLK